MKGVIKDVYRKEILYGHDAGKSTPCSNQVLKLQIYQSNDNRYYGTCLRNNHRFRYRSTDDTSVPSHSNWLIH